MTKALFLFQDLAKSNLSDARFEKYLNWVNSADEARAGSLGKLTVGQANQYDKAEGLITWNTFAPLLRMDRGTRDSMTSAIIRGYRSKNRLYCYKLDNYRGSIESLRADIPHRSLAEITNTLLGVGWVSIEFAASTVYKKAMDLGLLTKGEVQQVQDFYEERRIRVTM
ncbi:MAG: hypothetical protein WCC94_12230 [Candidatus Bathyarchaeia archaeon]